MGPTEMKTALITGASSGIGRALALWFAKRGTRVYAAARRLELLEELAAAGQGQIIPVALDVSDERSTVRTLQVLDDACDGLDVVVANAGVGDATPAQHSTWEMVERVLKVNVTGAAATLTAVLPRMVKRNRGRVVGISSLSARRGMGGFSCYSGSKAFLSTFLESLRVDLHGTDVRVTCVEPGFIKTAFTEKLEGVVPMPFRISADRAAEKIGNGILRGTRLLAFPWQHAWGTTAMGMIPASIYEPLAKKATRSQVAALEASLGRGK